MVEKDGLVFNLPNTEDARKIVSNFRDKVYRGEVARIYHPDGSPWCISTPVSSILGMSDPIWSEKINIAQEASKMLENNSHIFTRLFVPKIHWADHTEAIALVEWVAGENLEGRSPEIWKLYAGLEYKTEGALQYLKFLDLLHRKGQVFADHKPSSIVAVYEITGGSTRAEWKYGLVDVQMLEPETGSLPNTMQTRWKIELGQGGANNAIGENLDKTLLSFYKFSLAESDMDTKYRHLTPIAIRNLVSRLFVFDTAAEAANTLSRWRSGETTSIDSRRDQLEEVLESSLFIDSDKSSFNSVQKQVRNLIDDTLKRKVVHSDIQIAKGLAFLEYQKHI